MSGRSRSAVLSRLAPAVLSGTVAALAAWSVLAQPFRLDLGTPAWRRLVYGVGPEGRLGARAAVLLPGLPRLEPVSLILETENAGAPVTVGVAVDGGVRQAARSDVSGALLVTLPASGTSGARLDLMPDPGAPLALRSLAAAEPHRVPKRPLLLGALLAGLVAALAGRGGWRSALALGSWAGALVGIALAPPLLWASLPSAAALARLLPSVAAAAAALAFARRAGGPELRTFARGAAILAALVFGAWVRAIFLPSAGSWDTEYWKTWMLRAESHGLTRVYGDPEPFDGERLLRQARGQEPLWKAPRAGREYVVDYPPLAMAGWRGSLAAVRWVAPRLDRAEAENVAAKLPPILGDLGGVLVLLWVLRDHPRRALGLAALYWALPVSWLSSAVLGFLDAALTPLTAVALVAAGGGRPILSGLALALACLIKPTAGLVAPAVGAALAARRAWLARAIAAVLTVAVLVMVPFAMAGTLAPMLVQTYRIVFQERLSGGFPNPWWLAGHALTLRQSGMAAFFEPVRFVRHEALGIPARLLGALAFLAVAVFVTWRQRRYQGARPALLAGATLVFAYGMLAVGVHENHPHPLYLLLFATGLFSRRLRVLTAVSSTVYVLNMLAMSGLGRFYGPRHAILGPIIHAAAGLRMAPGLDITLLLSLVNVAVFVWMLVALDDEMRGLADPAATPSAPGPSGTAASS